MFSGEHVPGGVQQGPEDVSRLKSCLSAVGSKDWGGQQSPTALNISCEHPSDPMLLGAPMQGHTQVWGPALKEQGSGLPRPMSHVVVSVMSGFLRVDLDVSLAWSLMHPKAVQHLQGSG